MLHRIIAVAAFAALTACGGGSGGSTPAPPTGETPSPAPAPAPAPTPSPAPAPETLRAFAATAAPSLFYFYGTRERSSDGSFSGQYSNRQGQFGLGLTSGIKTVSFGSLGLATRTVPELDIYHGLTFGIESAGGTAVSFVAPAGSRAFSPTTSIIEWARSQDLVKRAMGLDSGAFSLPSNPNLTRFDGVAALVSSDAAVAREGGRVATANLRAMALATAFERVKTGSIAPYPIQPDYRGVGEFIASRGGLFLFANDEMTRLLRAAVPATTSYRDDVLSAAAHLVITYATAIGTDLTTREQAARFLLGIRGDLVFRLDQLLRANTTAAADAARAVTVAQLQTSTARFSEVLPFPDGFFFPGPDFVSLAPGASTVVRGTGFSPNLTDVYSLVNNDFYALPSATNNAVGFFGDADSRVTSVSVPSATTGQVTAVLEAAGTVRIGAAPGFSGVTYFDYVVRHPSGDQATGRVYVTVRG